MPSDTNMLPATPHSKEALSSDQQLVLKGMALDMVANAVLITDIDGTILWVNPAFTHLTGYAPEEVIGQTPRLLKSGMHSSQFYKKLWETILVGKTWRGSFTNRRKDGTPYYDEHTITPIRSDDGMRITHFVAIMNDVTMRRQAEAAWRKSEGRFRLLGEQAMDAFFLHDDHGKLLDVNRRACESLGYSKEELLNMSVSDVSCLSEEEVRNVWVQLQTASTITVNDYHRRKDGTQFPVEIRVGSVEIEGEKLFLGLARDITERKQAEQALTESQSRYRSLFENMLGGYAYCRMLFEQGHAHDFIYLEVNSAFEALTGLKNVVGKKVSEVIPKIQETNPELFEIYGRVALTGNPEKYETYLEPLGKWFSISVYSHEKEHFSTVFENITERKRAEEDTVRSLALLRATLDSTADGILTISLDRQILSFNEIFVKMWRVPAEILDTNDDNLAIQFVLDQLQTPELFLAKVRHLYDHPLEESFDVLDFKDGRVFERFSRPMLAEGRPIGRVWSFRDVTERKRAEQAMSESEMRFRTLVDESPVAIGISRNGTGIYANQRFSHIFGLKSVGEFIGSHMSDYFAPEFQDESRERVRRRSLGLPVANEFETIGLRSDGSTFPVHVVVAQAKLADGMAEIGFLTDITDRKQAEARIAEQAAFLDKARDAIIVRDLGGKILFWNKGAERMYGWTDEEAVGRNVLEILHTNPKQFEELTALTISRGEWKGELEHHPKGGRETISEVRCTLIRDDEGRPKSVLSINTDITEKKKVEAQFLRAQRMESIGTLAGGVAHDLNNILAPIMTSIEILKAESDNPRAAKILDTIELSAKRGADIVRQVLSFARGLKGERIEIQPKHLLKELENIIRDTFPKDIRLQFFTPNNTWTILGDPTQLHQILLNLCVNARDAMPSGGNLTIQAENCVVEEQDAVMNLSAKPGRYVKISVTDSGTGMTPDILGKIFDPFFTTKPLNEGTGLGLSTVMAIVKSHEGTVDVYSEPGKGTTFNVCLPAMELSCEAGQDPSRQVSLPRGNGETVLVVDDEVSILIITSQTLQSFGYQVLTAKDGAEALAIYSRHENEIAVVLTDVMMPVLDGTATIHALRQINPAVKIVAMSGLDANRNVVEASGAGPKHFLMKPYTAETLLKTMREVLDEA